MSERVVVLGAGYAGCVAVRALERERDDVDLTWVSETDFHLVLHEVHRAVRDPGVGEQITIPVDEIAGPDTTFREARVVGLDPRTRRIEVEDGEPIDYDYALVALGSDTAFYGIPGLRERAHTVKGIDDAVGINEAVRSAAADAGPSEPARVVVGGAGLSGVQTAGELAALRDEADLPIEVAVVEALPTVLPRSAPALQRRLRPLLEARDVDILTDDPVTEAAPGHLHFDEREPVPYHVLVWTGGITGREAFAETRLASDHRRLSTDSTFVTSDDRVFAVGDAAVVGLDGDPAPPTAQAAWDAAQVAAENVVRSMAGEPLVRWTHRDKGTLVSVGEDALAHDVLYSPVETFGGPAAVALKKLVAARWIATVTNWRRGLAAWDAL